MPPTEPLWSYSELVVIALVIPMAPILALILCELWDGFVGWLIDAPDLAEDAER